MGGIGQNILREIKEEGCEFKTPTVKEILKELEKQVVIIRCPVCKSENIADNSTYQNNGIIGPGCASWKTSDSRSCNDCGVIFKPVKGNGL